MSDLIKYLSIEAGLTGRDVRSIIRRAPISYKYYEIDKRRGGKRLISQPAKEVKLLQRLLVRRLSHLPIHEAATAYRTGISIRANALRHVHNGPIKKYDFKDFFHSIKIDDWLGYARKYDIFRSEEDLGLSGLLFFCKSRTSNSLQLAMGAPSSPWLSNILMYDIDEKITNALISDNVTYTRYADDLTFSGPRTGHLTVVDSILRRILRDVRSPKLVINEEKTVVATKKFRRVVTGLVLSNDGKISLGRDRKRKIRATVHAALNGNLDGQAVAKLLGMLAFAHEIEPDFVKRLNAHYGANFKDRFKIADSTDQISGVSDI